MLSHPAVGKINICCISFQSIVSRAWFIALISLLRQFNSILYYMVIVF